MTCAGDLDVIRGVRLHGLTQGARREREELPQVFAAVGDLLDLQVPGALGDIDRAVGDAFQVAVHLQNCGQQAQVAADRLVEGQQPDDFHLDADLLGVDLLVPRDDPPRQRLVGVEHDLAALVQHVLDLAGHAQRAPPQVVEQVHKMRGHGSP